MLSICLYLPPPASVDVNECMAVFEARTSALQPEERTMQSNIDNLATMICMLLPLDSVMYALISTYETKFKLDRDDFLALTDNSNLSCLNASPPHQSLGLAPLHRCVHRLVMIVHSSLQLPLLSVRMKMSLVDPEVVVHPIVPTSLLVLFLLP